MADSLSDTNSVRGSSLRSPFSFSRPHHSCCAARREPLSAISTTLCTFGASGGKVTFASINPTESPVPAKIRPCHRHDVNGRASHSRTPPRRLERGPPATETGWVAVATTIDASCERSVIRLGLAGRSASRRVPDRAAAAAIVVRGRSQATTIGLAWYLIDTGRDANAAWRRQRFRPRSSRHRPEKVRPFDGDVALVPGEISLRHAGAHSRGAALGGRHFRNLPWPLSVGKLGALSGRQRSQKDNLFVLSA